METTIWLLGTLLLVVLLAVVGDRSSKLSRRVAALERSVALLLRQAPFWNELSAWQKLALGPSKLRAVKAYMDETGAGLAEASRAVDAWLENE